jgi:ribosomal protein S18 acetylase RimI-like enzyme
MPQDTLRDARPNDAALLARLGARTFTETFGHLYPPQDLAGFLAQAYSPERLAAYLSDPRAAAWILEAGGEAIGYALVGACDLPHPEVTATCGELKRLYVLAAHRGGGRGGRLLDVALNALESRGQRPIWIGVWSENFGAQKLYGRLGFEKVGEYEFHVGAARDREFIMRRG